MRMKFMSAISIALATLMIVCSLAACDDGNGNGKTNGKAYASTKDYTYKTDISDVSDALNTTDEYYLTLANKSNIVGADHAPQDLIKIEDKYCRDQSKTYLLSGNAYFAVIALIEELEANGYKVYITSAYRSYEYQQDLFDRYCKQEKEAHPTWSDTEVKDYVLTYSAYPGTSEHQTGLCVDFITDEMEGLWNYGSETPNNPYDKGFAETSAYTWLLENAHKFGFILRYPEDKTNITGYSYESWHYRFVGVSAATEIYEKGITLEEYLGK